MSRRVTQCKRLVSWVRHCEMYKITMMKIMSISCIVHIVGILQAIDAQRKYKEIMDAAELLPGKNLNDAVVLDPQK